VVEQGPVSTTLQVNAGGDPSHTTKVTLFAPAIDRVAFEGHVNENFGDTQEWTSGFNLAGGTWRHEEVGMIATAKRESDGGDYADQNARTDWLTLNHFTDLSQTDRGVTVSSWESPFFRLGTSTPTTLDAGSTRMQALVGMQDNPEIGIPNQGGDDAFMDRFALRTHDAWNAPAAMRFALEHQNPLVTGAVTGVPNAPLPEETYSMLNVSDPDVLLWALKPAQSGSALDLVARAWNLGSINKTVKLHPVNERLSGAREVTHIEQDKGAVSWLPIQMTDDIGSQQIKSWRLKMSGHPTYVPPGNGVRLSLSVAPNPVALGAGGFIRFVLPADGPVKAQILDVSGRRVATLANETRPAGRNEIAWNTGGLRPGIYLVTVDAAGHHERVHAVVLR
jgi:alpha-mannosidase